MPTEYKIEQGDSILRLAFKYGTLPGTIWNFPANQQLKRLRKDMNVLMPGDVVMIPDKKIKELPAAVDQLHQYVRQGFRSLFRLQVFDVEEPRACQKYILRIDDEVFEGQTDKSGTLEQYVRPDSRQGELTIGPDRAKLTIDLGHLDPIDQTSGWKKRLSNLGYDCGKLDGEVSPEARAALMAFQKRFGLPDNGEPDSASLQKLEAMHDQISEFPPEAPDPNSGGESATEPAV